jgi:trk system potassium uptake protein TrkH
VLDLRPILHINGILLTTLAVVMVIRAGVDAAFGEENWRAFLAASGLTLFVGVALIFTMRGDDVAINIRQAFVLTSSSWLFLTAFAALPFFFSGLELSFTDSFFEAMSGITTTGATVLTGLDRMPEGVLIWRALLQWLGGIGIIVMAVAILPLLHVGGMQLFRTESSDRSEKVLPRATQLAGAIGSIYAILTLVAAICYWMAGMSGFEAIAHSMTTISTGGFSTTDGSIGAFASSGVEWFGIVFMIVGSLPFVLYLQAVRGQPGALWRDNQVQWFLGAVVLVAALVWILYWFDNDVSLGQALRISTFNIVSIVTGTGYSSADYYRWGPYAVTIFFLAMFLGGCAGSTTCGIKIFRFQVLYKTGAVHLKRLVRPHGVFIAYYNNRPITDDVATSVMSFFFFYVLVFVTLSALLGVIGLDFLTAVSGAASAISNVGPGLGEIIGPAGTYTDLPGAAKWVLSAGMLLGRLELFTILILLAPSFWRS